MRITAEQYAKALSLATWGQSESQIKNIVKIFYRTLEKNNQLALASTITRLIEKNWADYAGVMTALVTTRWPLSAEQRQLVNHIIKEQTGETPAEIQEETNDDVLGGVRIRLKDKVIDATIANYLVQLNEALI